MRSRATAVILAEKYIGVLLRSLTVQLWCSPVINVLEKALSPGGTGCRWRFRWYLDKSSL